MPLYTTFPHAIDSYTVDSSRDAGGGTTLTYTLADSGLPCSINTTSASEREVYAQMGILVSHTIALLTSSITTAFVRGMKVVATDTSKSFHIQGIRAGRAYGTIPAFTYLDCSEQL